MRRDITITAEPRETRGKNEARRLRARGLAPAVVYGPGTDPVAVALNPKEVTGILKSASGHNTIFNVSVAGQTAPAMIVAWQTDPIKGHLLHIDLQRIDVNKRITVKVPVQTVGEPKGVKIQGGLHELVTRELEIQCLPHEIPEHFSVDIADLMVGQNIRASEIPLSGSAILVTPPETVISHVTAVRATAAETEAETGAAAAPEPEVVKKGKKEEEAAKEEKKKK
jgi:large subunit ribosomal protein L25